MNIKKWVVLLAALFSLSTIQARLVFTTIDSPGFYQLSDELDNSVTIEVSDVTFDLNGHTITAATGIIINGGLDNITIMNGSIEATTDGIIANAGCTGITLDNMRVEGAIRGINFDTVTSGLIKNCEMTLNTTGLELDNSHKITVKDCIANCNTHAGYDLISSFTNCFENCKALSTGEGNVDIELTTVFGFVSRDGRGNIFERCIANSTQALSVTGSSSLIAGFALRGSEGCSKIIDSEAANSQTNADGFTVPYGILLEDTIDSMETVTGAFGPHIGRDVAWSPNSKYIAVTGSGVSAGDVQVFAFDRGAQTLTQAATAGTIGFVPDFDWSPEGQYAAIAVSSISTGNGLQVLKFDGFGGTLTSITGALGAARDVLAVRWSPDGRYIAAGQDYIGGDGDILHIYQFDKVTEMLTSVTGALGASGTVFDVDWSPDGKYLAVSQDIDVPDFDDNRLKIFSFNKADGTITKITGTLGIGGAGDVGTVGWSPDGKYLAVGGVGLTDEGDDFFIYSFDRTAGTLSLVFQDLGTSIGAIEVGWSSDGRYIVMGASGPGNSVRVFKFDQAAGTAALVAGLFGATDFVFSAMISPDGNYIAVGANKIFVGGVENGLIMLTGLQFPEKNVITRNTVYCNSGGQCPAGIGISGSSVANMIIGNTSYSNPIPRGANAPIVSSNYAFVTNVFNPLFGQIPSDLQNISLDGCDPICTPEDIALLVKQIKYKVCGIESKIDVVDLIESKVCKMDSQLDTIESKEDQIESSVIEILDKTCHIESQQDTIESKIDELGACGFTSLTSADVSAGAIALSTSGNYCLAEDITADITISASNITLDLNQRELTGTIATSGFIDNVIIRNGFVDAPAPTATPSTAINVGSFSFKGLSFPLIENITISCADSDVIQGRNGITVGSGGCIIKNCVIEAGGISGTPTTTIRGGHSIRLAPGTHSSIDGCIILSGQGGSLGNTVSVAGSGGAGISMENCLGATISNCAIKTREGGLAFGAASQTGGNGGAGISVSGTSREIVITDCTILETGFGGNAVAATSTGGDGGHGITIASTTSDISVRRCTIQNTGAGGTGTSTNGAPGKAVDDDVTTAANLSQIFANFAHNIANSTKFDLQAAGEAGILTPNPPTAAVVNPLANVYSS